MPFAFGLTDTGAPKLAAERKAKQRKLATPTGFEKVARAPKETVSGTGFLGNRSASSVIAGDLEERPVRERAIGPSKERDLGPVRERRVGADTEKVDVPTGILRTGTGDVYGSAMDVIGQGLSGEGTKGTQAAILEGREALATATRQAEGAAGASAAREGALGQGTAPAYAQKVRSEAMKTLAGQELGYAQLVSGEQKEFAKMGVQAGQFEQTEARLTDQFNKTFGLEKSANYVNQLMELSVDNPVLSAKLSDYLLEGKSGEVGGFTDEEKTQIQALADKAKARGEKVENIYDLVLANLEKELTGGTGITTTDGEVDAAGQVAGQTGGQQVNYNGTPISELNTTQWEKLMGDENALAELEKTGAVQVKVLNISDVFREGDAIDLGLKYDETERYINWNRPTDFNKDPTIEEIPELAAGEGGGSIIISNGVPYRLVKYTSAKNTKGVKGSNSERSATVVGLNLLTGEEEELISPVWRDI